MVNEQRLDLIDRQKLLDELAAEREKAIYRLDQHYYIGYWNGLIAADRIAQKLLAVEAVPAKHKNRLTLEELVGLDCPVWCSCRTMDGEDGFWCLCRKGIITAPSGRSFDCRDIPNWELYLCKVNLEEKVEKGEIKNDDSNCH